MNVEKRPEEDVSNKEPKPNDLENKEQEAANDAERAQGAEQYGGSTTR